MAFALKRNFKQSGGCFCGEIRYEISEKPIASCICYCRQCQKASGTESIQSLIIVSDKFKLTQGKPGQIESTADSGNKVTRMFCPSCGTHVYAKAHGYPQVVSIRTTTLDDPRKFKPDIAVFTESAQPWTKIPADIPTFRKGPPETAQDLKQGKKDFELTKNRMKLFANLFH